MESKRLRLRVGTGQMSEEGASISLHFYLVLLPVRYTPVRFPRFMAEGQSRLCECFLQRTAHHN